MSNEPPKKTKVRRLAKILGAVVLLVIGFVVFANIQDVNTKNSEEATPLHWAAAKNATETAQLLITQGAEICAKDTLGRTPLHWAAWNNAAETTKVLLTQGANINEKDQDGETPLHRAARNNATETAQLLLTQGADIYAK
ncbi:MAG: ankyrin repeat domain-containing protein, partial [Gemmatimonadetes bacterium]|nr:ankyrin repeat domain-containing protein [Gemmatimonadota bacterium]